ncbi:MAG: TonB-dependent receptor [Porticoccaceae bacterium]|nr:TonB-dependent receptor [Porticoccaceae bacterium]
MSVKDNWLYKGLAILAPAALLFAASVSYSQETIESQEVEADSSDSEQVDSSVEEVVVTGSRLKRTTFSSISPLQIITAEISREAGLLSAADILQTSTSAGGQQIDLTFSGFVLDNGPGSRTLNLRGLGAARTLIMINGRRMAPGGAEGAPYAPNLGDIPQGLVGQYEVLTDGASSVYGSDAIGGVTNVILKKDFTGLEIANISATFPKYDGGENQTLALTWGKTWDRGFVGGGFDYNNQESATYGSRPWMSECRKNYEIDSEGNYRSQDLYYGETYGMEISDCVPSGLARRVFVPGMDTGSIYYTPGFSNGGWGNFSEPVSPYGGFGIDTTGDGFADASYSNYSLNDTDYSRSGHLTGNYESMAFMAFGEYTFEGASNLTAYFETLINDSTYDSVGSPPQLFPDVPANNPYNLCNPNAVNGVDCGLAEDALYTNPAYMASFGAYYEGLCAGYGIPLAGCTPATFGLLNGPIGATGTLPIVSVKGDRSSSDQAFNNVRFVAGLKGDMPENFLGSLNDWTFDMSISYSKSKGESHRYGIRGDRLDLALGNYSTTDTPCVNDTGTAMADDVASGCVAVNMFAPSLYPEDIVGEFATQAETDYLFDSRDFDTEYEQTVFIATMGGTLFEMPNDYGPVQANFGVEYRKDAINSIPDAVARDGLFFGYFSDGGAIGSKDMTEAFFEAEAPLLMGEKFAKELNLNVSARITDDEIYGSNSTYSAKVGWRPINSLLIRGTYGTAFRAPNLRELFLMAQTGFNTIFDPCYVPEEAIDVFTGEYDSTADPREAYVLDNCRATGMDPLTQGFASYSVEQSTGGSLTLDPETSDSWTAGFSWEQEMTNEFDFGIGATYYEVDIDNTIIEPNGQYIVNDCYYTLTGQSAFCDRISRDADSAIDLLDNGFLNRDNEKARGVDVNINFGDDLLIGKNVFEIDFDVRATRYIERSTLFTDDDGNVDYEDYAGEWGFPSWKGESTLAVRWEKWRVQLRSNFTAAVEQEVLGIDPFSDIYDSQSTGTYGDTCLGTPVTCRDVGFAEDYWVHTLSASYREDNWGVSVGVRNLQDKAPPMVDGSEVTSKNNAAIGYGYDMMGRTIFVNAGYTF